MTTVAKTIAYKDSAGEWRWRAIANNGREVAASEEGFKNRGYAIERAHEVFPKAQAFCTDPDTGEDVELSFEEPEA